MFEGGVRGGGGGGQLGAVADRSFCTGCPVLLLVQQQC